MYPCVGNRWKTKRENRLFCLFRHSQNVSCSGPRWYPIVVHTSLKIVLKFKRNVAVNEGSAKNN